MLQLREILNQIWSKTHLFSKKKLFFAGCLLFVLFQLNSCVNESEKKSARNKIDYIHRIQVTSDSIPAEIAGRGEVLTSYSDCYTCHKIDERSMGPAFKDIAKRYPTNLHCRKCSPSSAHLCLFNSYALCPEPAGWQKGFKSLRASLQAGFNIELLNS